MPEIEIVKYGPEYRDSVRDCVYETGFGGDGADIYFEDRELFADMLTLYYTDYDSDYGFIPLVDGVPGGYLLGCLDTEKYETTMKEEIVPLLLKKAMKGEYEFGRGAVKNILRGFLSGFRSEQVPVPLSEYPAHLHIDLFEPYRRLGLGRRLITTYLDCLRDKNIPGVHLGTSSFHTLALPFYEKLGFQRLGIRRMKTSYFKDISDRDFYNIVYVMKLV